MGYYKDTGSLQSMASAEAILKKRMPEKVGILPVAELLFVAESMWVGEHDMKGHFHPSFRFVKAKRYNAKPHVLIELDGETLADINGRSKYYEGLGVEEGNIQQAVKSKSHYARGYHFVNSDEYSTLAKGEIENT